MTSMWARRHAGHQQPTVSAPGTGTAGGRKVHQHGVSPGAPVGFPPGGASAIAQWNSAPQRSQVLI